MKGSWVSKHLIIAAALCGILAAALLFGLYPYRMKPAPRSAAALTADQADELLKEAVGLAAGGPIERRKALALAESVIRAQPGNAALLRSTGNLLNSMGQLDYALALFEEVSELPDAPIKVSLALASFICEQAASGSENSPVGFVKLLLASRRAIAIYEGIFARDPDSIPALYGASLQWIHWPAWTGGHDDAIQAMERAVELSEDLPVEPVVSESLYTLLGDLLAVSGHSDRAFSAWKKGLEKVPDSVMLEGRLRLPNEALDESVREQPSDGDPDQADRPMLISSIEMAERLEELRAKQKQTQPQQAFSFSH